MGIFSLIDMGIFWAKNGDTTKLCVTNENALAKRCLPPNQKNGCVWNYSINCEPTKVPFQSKDDQPMDGFSTFPHEQQKFGGRSFPAFFSAASFPLAANASSISLKVALAVAGMVFCVFRWCEKPPKREVGRLGLDWFWLISESDPVFGWFPDGTPCIFVRACDMMFKK
jgi:hypothetical protein